MKRTTLKQLAREIDKLDSAYWAGIDALCERVRADHVVPFCKRKGWDFCAGMGSWSFHRPRLKAGYLSSVVDADELPKRLRAMLESPCTNRSNDIGTLIRDVRASEGFK